MQNWKAIAAVGAVVVVVVVAVIVARDVVRPWLRDRKTKSDSVAYQADTNVTVGPAAPAQRGARKKTCEDAISSYHGPSTGPDEQADKQTAAVLNDGHYLGSCHVPSSTAVSVCAAVEHGVAVGVTVTTDPADASTTACIDDQVRALRFPSSPGLSIARTTFKAQQ